ncbi:MAG: phosphate ABC transporter permease subunit PstC, partial [bacterium]|nr:phosphate ABC transporter permease subunit PstC [bacterium]
MQTAPLEAFRPRHQLVDRLFRWALNLSTWIYLALILGLFAVLVSGSWLAMRSFGLHFLIATAWDPVAGRFGALPFIFGTLVSSAIAIFIAALVGIFAAAYLAEFAPPSLARPLAFLIELLAAVPSVVYGLWGLFVLAPLMRSLIGPAIQSKLGWLPLFSGPIYGVGMLTASFILALMIVPTVAAISRDFIESVAVDQREAMLALGATRWETVRRVVLPAARSGIFGACVLALGRALGETIATTMVIG